MKGARSIIFLRINMKIAAAFSSYSHCENLISFIYFFLTDDFIAISTSCCFPSQLFRIGTGGCRVLQELHFCQIYDNQ